MYKDPFRGFYKAAGPAGHHTLRSSEILSVYTALPLLAALAAAVCPRPGKTGSEASQCFACLVALQLCRRHTRLAQGLASALGCLLGPVAVNMLGTSRQLLWRHTCWSILEARQEGTFFSFHPWNLRRISIVGLCSSRMLQAAL